MNAIVELCAYKYIGNNFWKNEHGFCVRTKEQLICMMKLMTIVIIMRKQNERNSQIKWKIKERWASARIFIQKLIPNHLEGGQNKVKA